MSEPLQFDDLLSHMSVADSAERVSHACDTCDGVGWVLAADQHTMPCPHCPMGADRAHQRLDRQFRATALPEDYRTATLSSWEQGIPSLAGKIMAYAAVQLFVDQGGQVNAAQIAAFAINILELTGGLTAELQQSLQQVMQSSQPTRNGLVLWGGLGFGKTWLLACAVNALRENHHKVRFVRLSEVLSDLSATWKKDSDDSAKQVLDRAQTVPYLCIDDFGLAGSGTPYQWQIEFVTELVRYRSNNTLPMLITTNLSPEALSDHWGVQAIDVILARCEWVHVGGEKVRVTTQSLRGLKI